MSSHEQVRTAAKLVREALNTLRKANVIVAGVAAAEDEKIPVEVLDATFKLRRVAIDLETETNALYGCANKMRAAAERAR